MGNNQLALDINRIQRAFVGGALFVYMLVPTNVVTLPGESNYFDGLFQMPEYLNRENNTEAFIKKNSITGFSFGYDMSEVICSDGKNMVINEDKKVNLQKLDQIEALEDGWNGNEAEAIDKKLISLARRIITALSIQPEIFPTACKSLQIEYEKENGEYLEIELTLGNNWHVFQINSDGRENEYTISAGIESLNRAVDKFYE